MSALPRKTFIVTLDGPAGSGKSTTAKQVAERLNFLYLDSGAMYRALTWLALEKQVDVRDETALANLADEAKIVLRESDSGAPLIFVNECDVTQAIRLPRVTNAISPIAANPRVREILVQKQRQMADRGGLVAEGRDMGTVVFPNAHLKIYLIAPNEVRAQRRMEELAAKGVKADFDSVYRDILKRDYTDSTREHSPLRRPDDAVDIDTGELTIEEQVEMVVRLAEKRMAACSS
ncbi:(d)CMP kinase [candidate division KSB1 bacterium]|nr:(d)CMP kinase [candidate division KSB1 bacterium]